MAARRLLVVMLILLGLSTLAAALVPNRPGDDDGDGTTAGVATETAPANTIPSGKALKLAIDVGGEQVLVVPMQVGDQLELVANSKRADQLEIPYLGLVETVGPDLPARFQIFAREPGDLGIRYTEADRVVARIEIAPRKPSDKQGEPES